MPLDAVFFDRDGTLIEEAGYLHRFEDVQILPWAFEAVRKVNASGALAIVVTNQSAVARGLLTEEGLAAIHQQIQESFRLQDCRLDAFYYCPHHPEAEPGPYTLDCPCRKPRPGLILNAIRDFQLDPARCFMIGDQRRDVEAGHRAGCRSILVRPEGDLPLIPDSSLQIPDFTAPHVLAAVNWILETQLDEV